MRLTRNLRPVLSILLFVFGCQGGAASLRVGTFINQRDTTQSLEREAAGGVKPRMCAHSRQH